MLCRMNWIDKGTKKSCYGAEFADFFIKRQRQGDNLLASVGIGNKPTQLVECDVAEQTLTLAKFQRIIYPKNCFSSNHIMECSLWHRSSIKETRGIACWRHPLSFKSHTKGCDETPKKTGFESIHTFVILWFNL